MQTGAEVLSKISSLKNTSESDVYKRNKAVMTGAFIGVAGGLLFGLVKGYSLISSAITGGVLAGLGTYLLLPKTDNEE